MFGTTVGRLGPFGIDISMPDFPSFDDIKGWVTDSVESAFGGVTDTITNAVQSALDTTVGSLFKSMFEDLCTAIEKIIMELMTWWVYVPTPMINDGSANTHLAGRDGAHKIYEVLGIVSWVGFVMAGASILILGMMIVNKTRRGEGFAAVGRAGIILAGVILIAGASAIASMVIVRDPDNNDPGKWNGATGFVQGSTVYIVAALVVLSIIIGGAKMAWEQRAEPGKELLKSLVTMIVVAAFAVVVVQLLVEATDSFSESIIRNSIASSAGENDAGKAVFALLALGAFETMPIVGIVFALVVVGTSFVQLILMVARAAMMVVLVGVLPLSASFSNTEMGKTWLRKNVSWLIAFILYKPAVAIIYATAFRLGSQEEVLNGKTQDSIVNALAGLMLMVMATIALPALMRFVTPAVAAVGAASGGMAAASMATGAVEGGLRAGDRGDSGPQGAQGAQGMQGSAGQAGASASSSGAAMAGGGAAGAGAGAAGAGAAGAGAGGAGAAAGAGGAAAGTAGTAGAAAAAGAPTAGVGAAVVVAGAAAVGAAKAGVDAAVGATVSTAEGSHANG